MRDLLITWMARLTELVETDPLGLFWRLLALLAMLVAAWRLGRRRGRRDRLERAREGSRRALAGRLAEQWAPYVPGFPGRPVDARFLGAPIDYIVFEGLSEGCVRRVLFVEIKSGRGQLSPVERRLRRAIEEGRVEWRQVRLEPPGRRSPGDVDPAPDLP